MRKIAIFGATSAIAQETAKLFAESSDRLFLVARNGERLKSVAEDLRVRGADRVATRVADLNDFDQHLTIIEEAAAALDGLDTALIAHGTLGDQKACQRDFHLAELEVRTNFLSPASLLTHLANRFEAQRSGTIAVISSVAGDRGRQSNYVYGSAKAGLTAFASGLRQRLFKHGVTVITIKPGFVDTPMTRQFRKTRLFASPEGISPGIFSAITRTKHIVYLPWLWRFMMLIIRAFPEGLFRRLSI